MRNYRILGCIVAGTLLVLGAASCSKTARIDGKVDGADGKQLTVKQLDMNVYNVLDTITAGNGGAFSYKIKVTKGQPEFVYIFYKDTKVGSLLLEQGEHATLSADTLGNFSVSGSEGSEKLAQVEKEYSSFIAKMDAAGQDGPAMAKAYLEHYRTSVRYVMDNPFSLTTIPVLYETLGGVTPIFNQPTDALFFKNAADSLKTVYPESRYVKALGKEAERRMKLLELNTKLSTASEAGYPDIVLPDINGEKKALSQVDAKVVLVHFWDASDAAQKMLNIETLLPIWNEYHALGFEIYAVCVYPDKAAWGSVVTSQKLPWINLNDGLGASSPAVTTYGIASLPNSFLIIDGELSSAPLNGAAGLRKVLDRELRRK